MPCRLLHHAQPAGQGPGPRQAHVQPARPAQPGVLLWLLPHHAVLPDRGHLPHVQRPRLRPLAREVSLPVLYLGADPAADPDAAVAANADSHEVSAAFSFAQSALPCPRDSHARQGGAVWGTPCVKRTEVIRASHTCSGTRWGRPGGRCRTTGKGRSCSGPCTTRWAYPLICDSRECVAHVCLILCPDGRPIYNPSTGSLYLSL